MLRRRLIALFQTLVTTCAFFVAASHDVSAADTGSIAGTVIDAETGKPIAGAAITAVAPTGRYQARSDAKGQFTFAGVVVDTYTVSAQVPGYNPIAYEGQTVTASEQLRLDFRIARTLRTIGATRTRARSITSAFQPTQTVDNYTYNANGIETIQGKAFNINQQQLLGRLPGVTVDRSGAPLIRGGFSFQTAFEYEGIDYTVPNRSVTNRFQNLANGNILNGVGGLEIIPGGGDATHGNTGTGLVSLTAKRGTYPAYANVDLETGTRPYARQFGLEYGWATPNSRVSNYLSYIASDQNYQYGPYGVDPRTIAASAITPDPNANSNVNAHFGDLYTTAFFNTYAQNSRDFVDNFVYKFGKGQQQSVQFFYQSQSVTQPLNYGGTAGLNVVDPYYAANNGFALSQLFCTPQFADDPNCPATAAHDASLTIFPQFPYGTPGQPIASPDGSYGRPNNAYTQFNAFKLQYSNILNETTAFNARWYRTFQNQQIYQPDQGLFIPNSGGDRTGGALDASKILGGGKHYLQFGGKYEFTVPFGSVSDNIDYLSAYTGQTLLTQIPYGTAHNLVPDFVMPQGIVTPNCLQPGVVPVGPGTVPCGYLAQFFPGGIPAMPTETEVPTAKQQVYGLYVQDTWSPNARIKFLAGLRLDGYNYLLPSDPSNPPAVTGLQHQRLYEPKLGINYRVGENDSIRANFGRSLAIPLASFIGTDLDRANYAPFAGIPSYDNTKGPFDPLRPDATSAYVCGPGRPVNGFFQGTQRCATYADQLYWLMRNYRFSLQSSLAYALRGATFTNYDLSYSHYFRRSSIGMKLTPFYRRGYDVVEQVRTLEGYDPISTVAALSPAAYSNLGLQKATGAELDLTREVATGLSLQWSATYINQIGNDPPGQYLPTQSLQLGLLYESPNLAPFQSSLGLTYKSKSGWRVNPVFTYRYGYPYGTGIYEAQTYDGGPVYIPFTDASSLLLNTVGGAQVANAIVDPQNPGTVYGPNVIATRGTEAPTVGPGTLRAHSTMVTDLTIEHRTPGKPLTLGVSVTNLFNQTADVPVVNLTQNAILVAPGHFVTDGTPTSTSPSHAFPPTAASPINQPYIVFTNQPPFAIRFYLQLGL